MTETLTIIGAGLAGCEAAWQAAKRGQNVRLYEMRPTRMTPAHSGGDLAELVCSNSLRGAALSNAVGLLKEEMRRLGSLIMAAADATAVPAGGALAVDRRLFSAYIEAKINAHPRIELIREEVYDLPSGPLVIAAGPLASPALSAAIAQLTGMEQLFFHDAIAPIVSADSVDMGIAFFATRYGKGDGDDYLNCPFTKEEYLRFHQALCQAELFPLRDFEEAQPQEEKLFSGCMPIEAMARSGVDTMRFGPLKPVGLDDKAYAVAQLRREDKQGNMYNLVGFQTRLTQGEQRRVFGLIPGLANAEFLRYGAMHRNTYIDSPRLLLPSLQLKKEPRIFFAGQISGVEGYVESAASGLAAGINAARQLNGQEPVIFPGETALGALLRYISVPGGGEFQPMNVNFGLLPPLATRIRNKQEKNLALAERALTALDGLLEAGL